MPNYGPERLNSRFSITIDRTQYSELKNFNDTTHFKNARLRGFMRNYEHKLLNSRTQRTSHLKTARLIGFMRSYGYELLNSRTPWDFGEVAGSMSKSNAMQEIKSKLKNGPIRLEEKSAKSKQSNIKIVEGDSEKDFIFNIKESNRIILQYFSVEKAITKSQLVEKFNNNVWEDNDDDAVKFAILFYIHSFILSEEPTTTVIDRKDFDLTESGRYIDYPWGKKAFDLLILHLHTKIKHDGKYFRLYGFPLSLQV
ncbi:hypothetical protein MTR67_040830 [Solanum verrucosum]|uniref:DUF1985 domain-containing protein n=1 Tax=Solanum verrucosum TaxID=315347 RepID=A0AAF0UKG3_SOLVR|nr:hypothetical protein MTR67_040830 [Solanum verrucosum]